MTKLAVVTASIDPEKTHDYWKTWGARADGDYSVYMVWNGCRIFKSTEHQFSGVNLLLSGEIMGTVPAFEWGVREAARKGAEVIACFHDDLEILEPGWDTQVLRFFESNPTFGLTGFGGGRKLGRPGMYDQPYDPMSLARHDFISNMRDAEAHGRRVSTPRTVACLDGFSQIGRGPWFERAWAYMVRRGAIHHAYDSWLGAIAARNGVKAAMIPVACHHAGGVTAVGNAKYQEWAREKNPAGDAGLWQDAHRLFYDDARDVLPIGW